MTVGRKVPPAQAAVRKASKPDSSWVACYDENGKLIGITNPENITPIAAPKPASKPPAAPAQQEAAAAAPAAPAPVSDADAAEDLRKRVAQVRKGLNGNMRAPEQVELANGLNRAAITALDAVHGRRQGRG